MVSIETIFSFKNLLKKINCIIMILEKKILYKSIR